MHAFPDAKFVQISTDYVFGDDDIRGSNPPKPDDKPRPVNVYGRHKLEAEQATLSLSPDNLVVRVNTLYDHTDQRNFFRLVYDNLTAGRSVIGLTDQFSNPISAFGAAELIIRLIEKKAVGIFHLGGNEFVSRCDLALRIAKFFNLNESLFDRATSDALQRPAIRLRFAGLDCQTTGLFLKTSMPSLDEDFIRIREELRDAAF